MSKDNSTVIQADTENSKMGGTIQNTELTHYQDISQKVLYQASSMPMTQVVEEPEGITTPPDQTRDTP